LRAAIAALGFLLILPAQTAQAQNADPEWFRISEAALTAAEAGRVDEARRLANDAIASLPADAPPEAISRVYCVAGVVSQRGDNGDKALSYYTEGLARLGSRRSELATNDVCLFIASAGIFGARGDQEKAKVFARRAAETYVAAKRRELPQGVQVQTMMLMQGLSMIGNMEPGWMELEERVGYGADHPNEPVPISIPKLTPLSNSEVKRINTDLSTFSRATYDKKIGDLAQRIAALAGQRDSLPAGDPGRAKIQAEIDTVAFDLNDATYFQGKTLAMQKKLDDAYRYLAVSLRDKTIHHYVETADTMLFRSVFLAEASRRDDRVWRLEALTSLSLAISERTARAAGAGNVAEREVLRDAAEAVAADAWLMTQ
jgi:hypothetical protein